MRILMISNHLGVQSGVQRYVQNLLLNLDTAKYHIDLFVGQCPADQASTAPVLEARGVQARCRKRNLGGGFVTHGARGELLAACALDGQSLYETVMEETVREE